MSCVNQSRRPDEILVGDDSVDAERTRRLVKEMNASGDIAIRYLHHQPALGQGRNVAALFSLAQGDRCVLLHDDDWLLPDTVEVLSACFDAHPGIIAAYGRQYVADDAGEIQADASAALNESCHRSAAFEGKHPTAKHACLRGQFPSDGYMVDTETARRVGYGSQPRAGDAVDFAFSYALGNLRRPVFFVNRHTAVYRESARSVIRGHSHSNSAMCAFRIVLEDRVSGDLCPLREAFLRRMAPAAIAQAALRGERRLGWCWYFSRYHLARVPTPGGLRRALMLARPGTT